MAKQRFSTLQTDLMDHMKDGWHLHESDSSYGTFFLTKDHQLTPNKSVDARVVNGLKAKGMFVRVGNELFLEEEDE